MLNATTSLLPFFLPAQGGQRYCLLHLPAPGRPARGGIIYIHPFAEELNKSRHVAAMQARAFAAAGYSVLQLDLYGCGDSSGDFGDARWSIWRNDLHLACAWLAQRVDGPLTLWGLRLGALLALELAAHAPVPLRQLLLWQPELDGRRAIDRFLRLRLAGRMLAGTSEAPGHARAELAAGRAVEVAGYLLAPELAQAIDAIAAASLRPPVPVYWLEYRGRRRPVLPPPPPAWPGNGDRKAWRCTSPALPTARSGTAPNCWNARNCWTRPPAFATTGSTKENASMHDELSTMIPLATVRQLALRFRCADDARGAPGRHTDPAACAGPRGVLIVTGGPQYRAGSHRQFVLLARFLAARGMAVLRFDYRGMGDSEGAPRDYRRCRRRHRRRAGAVFRRRAGPARGGAVGLVRRRHGRRLPRAARPAHQRPDPAQSLGAQPGGPGARHLAPLLSAAPDAGGVLA